MRFLDQVVSNFSRFQKITVAAMCLIAVSLIMAIGWEILKKTDLVTENVENVAVESANHTNPLNLEDIENARKRIIENREERFGASCLALYPAPFRRAAEKTGLEMSVLAAVAGYGSEACTKSESGKGNVMHVTQPSKEHVATAAKLLGIPVAALRWKIYAEHSAMLGAVMLSDYAKREGSWKRGLETYRAGPKSDRAHHAYAATVLAHIALTRRSMLSTNVEDLTYAKESSIDPRVDFPPGMLDAWEDAPLIAQR